MAEDNKNLKVNKEKVVTAKKVSTAKKESTAKTLRYLKKDGILDIISI